MLSSVSNFGKRMFFDFVGPLVDIFSTKTGYQIDLELPGVKKDDITIDCEKGVLSITANKKAKEIEGVKKVHAEREFGSLTRTFELPSNVETDKVEAVLNDGVLTLTIPKKETPKIEVKIQ